MGEPSTTRICVVYSLPGTPLNPKIYNTGYGLNAFANLFIGMTASFGRDCPSATIGMGAES